MTYRRLFVFLLAGALAAGVGYGLQARMAGVPPLGTLLDPFDGLYRTARIAQSEAATTSLTLAALDAPVTIVRDERSVPHIFAESDRDALIALGYVTAQDRLFQLDFIPRVASGRLAEAFGPSAVASDRFLRQTGMEWGAQKNLERIRRTDGLELDLIEWYGAGVNAYLDGLDPNDLPLEFRLLGYTPDRYRPIQAIRLLQYMNFDLTYQTDAAAYARLERALDPAAYRTLYPEHPAGLYAPILPSAAPADAAPMREPTSVRAAPSEPAWADARRAMQERAQIRRSLRGTLAEGAMPGKGSNNWAVDGTRSATGAPILAGDMHLSLFLPSIWYEVHLVTPSMNAYGLTIPGAPGLIEAFTDHMGWAFTNTGADQIDHYALAIDSSQTRYRYEGEWRELRTVVDTIRVNGDEPVLDTLRYSHFGPVHLPDPEAASAPVAGAVAERWVAHEPSRTLRALWHMAHADSLAAFEDALRDWDTPMQNILYAGRDGHIAIRSTGHLPVRRSGHGRGLLDGTTDAHEWIGRVPFDELPYSRDPAQGFLTSSNQTPTGPDYPHYLGHDWGDGYRSLRLDSLLRATDRHTVADFKRYQADVDAQQRDVFVPLLRPLDNLSPKADSLRRMLRRWNGEATLDRSEPLILKTFLDTLRTLAWDEPVFDDAPPPEDAPFVQLLQRRPQSRWFDVQSTPQVEEDGPALLAKALEATAATLTDRYGWNPSAWRWGDHHKVVFRHLSQTAALRPLWRGPFPYPGFAATVSPARGDTATHSASQRLIVDFSTNPPSGIGVVPGGQSGNPLHPQYYDTQIPAYVDFEYFDLRRPSTPADLPDDTVSRRTVLTPDE
jgi:penicillin amidase